MELAQFIAAHGDKEIAQAVGVTVQIVSFWRRYIYPPSLENARKLIAFSEGLLTYQEIFDPYFRALDARRAVARNASQN